MEQEKKNKGGRPPMYKTVDEMQKKIDQYFIDCEEKELPLTVTGLAIALGFTTRQALINYEAKPEFVDAVKRAKLIVESFAEKMLYLGKTPTGAIFALKNFGWTDKQEHDHTHREAPPITGMEVK